MTRRLSFLIDKSAIGLSGLCLLHCVATTVALAMLSVGGIGFFQHDIHKTGLVIAMPLAALGLGWGVLRHGRWGVLALGTAGIGFMGVALMVTHGQAELVLTVIGVLLVAAAHWLNIRCTHA